MRPKQTARLILCAAISGLTGCLPGRVTVAPVVRGRVVTDGGYPVAGAIVTILTTERPLEGRYEIATVTTSDPDGRFHDDGKFYDTLVLVMGAPAHGRARVEIFNNGSRVPTVEFDFNPLFGYSICGPKPDGVKDLGSLVLPPKAALQ